MALSMEPEVNSCSEPFRAERKSDAERERREELEDMNSRVSDMKRPEPAMDKAGEDSIAGKWGRQRSLAVHGSKRIRARKYSSGMCIRNLRGRLPPVS